MFMVSTHHHLLFFSIFSRHHFLITWSNHHILIVFIYFFNKIFVKVRCIYFLMMRTTRTRLYSIIAIHKLLASNLLCILNLFLHWRIFSPDVILLGKYVLRIGVLIMAYHHLLAWNLSHILRCRIHAHLSCILIGAECSSASISYPLYVGNHTILLFWRSNFICKIISVLYLILLVFKTATRVIFIRWTHTIRLLMLGRIL